MLGLPTQIDCLRCKKIVLTGFDKYEEDEDGSCNPYPGVWVLDITCTACGCTWKHTVDLTNPLNTWATRAGVTFFEKGLQLENNTPVLWCINLHRKVSKLWEAYTDNRLKEPCGKPIALTCVEEELADLALRTFDIAWQLGIDMDAAVTVKHEYNRTRPRLHRRP